MKSLHSAIIIFTFFCSLCCKKTNSSPGSPIVQAVEMPQWFKNRGLEGKAAWDSINGTLRINTNVNWGGDDDVETFYFQPPAVVKTIVIAANVTVTGGFRADHKMTIRGEDRNSSIIFGTNTAHWSIGPDGINQSAGGCTLKGDDKATPCNKWQYSAIAALNMPSADTVYISTLTVKNARAFSITAQDAPIKADNIYIVEQRTQEGGNNCDGFAAGKGSSLTNSTIEVTDDAIKLYKDMMVKNVTLKMRRNGAPFQLGWGSEGTSTHTIENVLVIGMDPQGYYNTGLFSWKSASATTTRNISINGLKTQNYQNAKIWSGSAWVNGPVFEIRGAGATLNITGNNADINFSAATFPAATGNISINLCGNTTLSNMYNCGNGSSVTGNN